MCGTIHTSSWSSSDVNSVTIPSSMLNFTSLPWGFKHKTSKKTITEIFGENTVQGRTLGQMQVRRDLSRTKNSSIESKDSFLHHAGVYVYFNRLYRKFMITELQYEDVALVHISSTVVRYDYSCTA